MAQDFSRAFYHTTQWKRCRIAYGASRRWLCENCLAKGIYTPGVIIHHIEELTPENITNPEIALGFDNLRLVCRKCHAEEHEQERKGRRYLIDDNGDVILFDDPDRTTPPIG